MRDVGRSLKVHRVITQKASYVVVPVSVGQHLRFTVHHV